MDTRKKILAVAIIAALVGGVIGAFAFRAPGSNTEAANSAIPARDWVAPSSESTADNGSLSTEPGFGKVYTGTGQTAYRDGYNEAIRDTRAGSGEVNRTGSNVSSVTRTRYANTGTYVQPRQRTFWDKHRDKLTTAMGAGGGALVGGLIGGKKGAGIGLLAGGGGSALYTYKIRKRNRRY